MAAEMSLLVSIFELKKFPLDKTVLDCDYLLVAEHRAIC